MSWTRGILILVLATTAAACAAASGYDPKRYGTSSDAGTPVDPDTVALAPAPKTSIADPRLGPAAPSTPAPSDDDAGVAATTRPLALVMREMEPAMRKREWAKIVALLEDVAARSKDDKTWVGFAEKGIELAKKEDVGAVRKQCDACHAARRKPRKSP